MKLVLCSRAMILFFRQFNSQTNKKNIKYCKKERGLWQNHSISQKRLIFSRHTRISFLEPILAHQSKTFTFVNLRVISCVVKLFWQYGWQNFVILSIGIPTIKDSELKKKKKLLCTVSKKADPLQISLLLSRVCENHLLHFLHFSLFRENSPNPI